MAESNEESKNTSDDQSVDTARAEKIVMNHVGFSMVAGAMPFPLIDIAAVTAIQVDMIRQLAEVHGVDFTPERGKSLASSIVGATLGNVLGRAGASILKIVPGIGTLLGIGSQVIFAGAATYALGMVFKAHFEEHGTLDNANLGEMKGQFESFLRKGKNIARGMRGRQQRDEILETIEKLKDLKDRGTITEEEFEASKKELLGKLAD